MAPKYTVFEKKMLRDLYEEGLPLKEIAKQLNKEFHKGEFVRTPDAISQAVLRWVRYCDYNTITNL